MKQRKNTASANKHVHKQYQTEALEDCLRQHLLCYLDHLQGQTPSNMYAMLLAAVEKPLLSLVLEHTNGNQSKAAQWLGINRNTLRKLLVQHQLID